MVQLARVRPSRRHRWIAVAGVLTALVVSAPAVAAWSPAGEATTRPGATTSTQPERVVATPVEGAGKPRKVCGRPLLDGPSTRPPGATVVRPTDDLPTVVNEKPPGTTFWLTPGVHTFGNDQYDQVGPKDGDAFIGAPRAVIDGRRVNRYAFGGNAEGVTISYLTIQNFGVGIDDNPGEGVVNHDSGDRWFVHHNTIQRNAGAGVFLGNGSDVVDNCLRLNGEYGFSSFEVDGVNDIVLQGNEIARNNTADWETIQPGCGCSGGGKFWDTRNARVVGNYVHHNHGPGLWADTNDVGFLFEDNYVSDNDAEGIFYEISYNATIRGNTLARNGWVVGRADADFPVASIYLSESGSDVRAGGLYGRQLLIVDNLFVDNWAGIMAWENPDRFAGSPHNTSSGFSTLVNPGVATLDNCGNPALIGTAPYFDDCRWKTQHLRVVHNAFTFDPDHVAGCTAARGCGFMGLVSNVGTTPDWSPYQGYVVPDNISLHQDNLWRLNTYQGPWLFMIRQLGSGQVTWSEWRSAPYFQDAGSTMNQ